MTILEAVRSGFNQAGLSLLPVRNDGSKAPDTSSWREFMDTRASVEQMRAWHFETRTGFGMVAGQVSGYRECWDFDCFATYEAFLAAAEACGLGDLVRRILTGYEDETPGGGRRWIVQYPESIEWRDCTLARRPGRDGEPKVKTLIELPTFAILAPSNGSTHPTGRPYTRRSGGFETIAAYSVEERDALLELARSFDQMPRRELTPSKTSARTAASDLRPGDDFNQRASWPDLLRPAGWTHVYDRGDVSYWCRPGKSFGVSATTNYGGSDLFYPFTSSTGFDPETSYSKFAVFAALHHGGDFRQAALALATQGYGVPSKQPAAPRVKTSAPIPARVLDWTPLSDVARERVQWHWPRRLAIGKITLLVGDGGFGKSHIAYDVAARTTIGGRWPDGGDAPLGTVVILSAEDGAGDVIRPTIEASGGDPRRVIIVRAAQTDTGTRTFNLHYDLEALERLIVEQQARLLILDPVLAYFGTHLDSYRDSDVRSVLEPLQRLTERLSIATLGVMHINKATGQSARHRILAGVGFVNAARLVYCVGPDPEDATRFLVAAVKGNLKMGATLAYRFEDVGDDVARIVWDGQPVTGISAEDVLNATTARTPGQAQDAKDFLRELLEQAPTRRLKSADVIAAAKEAGISKDAVWRAKTKLGLKARREGFGEEGVWWWTLPLPSIEADAIYEQNPNVSSKIAKIGGAIYDASIDRAPIYAIYEERLGNSSKIAIPREAKETAPPPIGGDDDLPACLAELSDAPDLSDPIGAHDEVA